MPFLWHSLDQARERRFRFDGDNRSRASSWRSTSSSHESAILYIEALVSRDPRASRLLCNSMITAFRRPARLAKEIVFSMRCVSWRSVSDMTFLICLDCSVCLCLPPPIDSLCLPTLFVSHIVRTSRVHVFGKWPIQEETFTRQRTGMLG